MPLYRREQIRSTPVGRLLACNTPSIATPSGSKNNASGKLALAPAVVCCEGDRISVDFLGSFPENFNAGVPEDWGNPSKQNPKFNFGPLALELRGNRGAAVVGPVSYANTDAGNARGWVFDFDTSNNTAAKRLLADPDSSFHLHSETRVTCRSRVTYQRVAGRCCRRGVVRSSGTRATT